MGFSIIPRPTSSLLTVFIDYDLPEGPGACALGRLLDGFYAGWCTRPWPLTPRATSRSRTDLGTRTYCREAEAVDPFVYRVGLEIGALTAALGELDTLVFTAGIEEHPPVIRERISRTPPGSAFRSTRTQISRAKQ
ncbi:hypothetical protein [Mesorhizobium sp. 2RAF21]|jgi:hypothetical protein|uniref:hypothetical protein n=1 Tax=Mesorhizobium sp. 2RAF21 TaxID=3232995 RepID=UPI003F9C8D62